MNDHTFTLVLEDDATFPVPGVGGSVPLSPGVTGVLSSRVQNDKNFEHFMKKIHDLFTEVLLDDIHTNTYDLVNLYEGYIV